MKRFLIVLALVGVTAGGVGLWYTRASGAPTSDYRTAKLKRGNVVATIAATGTLEPEEVVDIGAQVAGMVLTFGQDPRDAGKAIDYGTRVEAGTVLARIDDSVYRTQVEQARANLVKAEADLTQLKAKVTQTEREWTRAQNLNTGRTSAIAGVDYDLAQANYETARAGLAVGDAMVAQAQASLRQAEINLGYCTITSPVKGVIIDRRVNVGQTVVSSLNAPSLFLIAKDLTRMQIWASVNEADIGHIHPGQPVTFSVDAFPGETFQGQVAQIRLNATMTQNVVTYTVVISTDNSSGKLLPYLTANVQFEVSRRDNVPVVPNTALRWQPTREQIAPDAGTGARLSEGQGVVWVRDGGFVRPVRVQTGLTDG
ncbi:MAG TPA: efflux RND transporter periplasmic adaptor subunit, partial [Gemmataceae bacterium]|nr:efflux RND transporter periplasmic adaptor subunit [Gemmataceae bacterium]